MTTNINLFRKIEDALSVIGLDISLRTRLAESLERWVSEMVEGTGTKMDRQDSVIKCIGELDDCDIVESISGCSLTGGWSRMLVLSHDREKHVIRFARPMAKGHLFGTTCVSCLLSAETFDVGYDETLPAHQAHYLVVGKDTSYYNYLDSRRTMHYPRLVKYWERLMDAMCDSSDRDVPHPNVYELANDCKVLELEIMRRKLKVPDFPELFPQGPVDVCDCSER